MNTELQKKVDSYKHKRASKFPDRLYKVGVTTQWDVVSRFSEATAEHYGFANTPFGEDYVAQPILSRWVTVEEGKKLEEAFAKAIPRNVWTYKNYNGVSECRILTNEEVDTIADNIRKRFPTWKYGYMNKGRKGYIKFYFVRFDKKR